MGQGSQFSQWGTWPFVTGSCPHCPSRRGVEGKATGGLGSREWSRLHYTFQQPSAGSTPRRGGGHPAPRPKSPHLHRSLLPSSPPPSRPAASRSPHGTADMLQCGLEAALHTAAAGLACGMLEAGTVASRDTCVSGAERRGLGSMASRCKSKPQGDALHVPTRLAGLSQTASAGPDRRGETRTGGGGEGGCCNTERPLGKQPGSFSPSNHTPQAHTRPTQARTTAGT